ncbi:zinc-binding dehydrogenase [Leptospira sp. GIMC2001]|uniref:zinc-binding dehydrogenase n=1 Tax=Leptospira sp. GIMC2001 TaxID=1513297 RepID=UPI0023490974|nr:zinc-binding dehydrogenase [Leptospira sp. GIMC2001]WCL49842.1 zinc-binding dehydrogenase [Leptospira sp. GIMC2001]
MKGIILTNYTENPQLEFSAERKNPELKPNQVLIKNAYGSINPSDLMFLRGLYGIKKKLPVVPGFEGSGTVEEVGSEIKHLKKGDRVACVSSSGDGTWGEFMATEEENCIPLLDSVSLEAGASIFVNPMTAWAMVNRAIKSGHTGIVQTAGASALGKMVVRICKEKNIPLISIVRRDDQVAALHEIGAEHVVNSSSAKFDREFMVLAKKQNTTYLLDAVAGEVAGKALTLMPAKSTLLSYGALSEKEIPIHAGIMIFQDKKVEGFWLTYWIQEIGIEAFHKEAREVQKHLDTTFHTVVNKIFPIEQGSEAVDYYSKNMSLGKVLIGG